MAVSCNGHWFVKYVAVSALSGNAVQYCLFWMPELHCKASPHALEGDVVVFFQNSLVPSDSDRCRQGAHSHFKRALDSTVLPSLIDETLDVSAYAMFIPQAHASSLMTDQGPSTIIPSLLLNKPSRFSLDMSGVAGLLGGDDAVSTMVAVHIYENRRWLGWYNTPGSFRIFERLSSFAKFTSIHNILDGSIFWKSLSQNVHVDPAALLQLGTSKGPKFRAAHSGTVIEETSYFAALVMKECAAWSSDGSIVPGRKTQPIRITIAVLDQTPASEMHPAAPSTSTPISASIPIIASVGTCALCAICRDWYASLLILVGIIASGLSCLVLGSTDLVFTHPEPASGSPAGDGILGSDKDIVLLKGSEGAVNSITRGKLSLRFSSKTHLYLVRCCSVLFFIQCISQLLLIPQASLFGQVLFLISLGVSAVYSSWVCSSDKEKVDRKMLFERILENPKLRRYTLGTRTSAVVFMLLVLRPQDPAGLLNELLPNDTKVWKQWKVAILKELNYPNGLSLFEGDDGKMDGFSKQEQALLELLYEDARAAYGGYRDYLRVDSL